MRIWTLPFIILVACGGGPSNAFGPTFPDNRSEDIEAVLSRVAATELRDEPPVAAGLTSAPELYVVDLAGGGLLWRKPVSSPVSAPQVAGNLVVLHESSGVVARDLRTGAEHFTIDDDALHLAGVAGDGDLTLIVLTTGGGVQARSKLVLARGRSVAWQKTIPHAVGQPAVIGNLLFIPWATQNVTVIDADQGAEIARLRITDSTVGHVFRVGRDVYLGQRGVFRLTSSIASGSTQEAAHFEPQVRDIPGDPAFLRDPYRPTPEPGSAVHRIRMEWRPSGSGEEITLDEDTLYVVFYSLVFALDPEEDEVKWVYQHGQDIVGATAQPGGLLVADAAGSMALVGSDGRRHWHTDIDAAPVVVSFRAGAHVPSGAPEGDAISLHDQLLAVAQNTDARLVPARTLAVHMLHALEEPDVTGHLVALCDDRRAPAAVKQEACGLLALRTTGPDHILTGLRRHARFLEGTEAPPVGPLAQAAVSMELTEAVPLLLSHLTEPGTAEADLAPLLEALKTLGERSAVEPVRDFMRLYHAEAESDAMLEAMGKAAEALAALEGPASEESLQAMADDSLAPGPVRGRIMQVIESLHAEEETAEGEQAEGEEGEQDSQGDGEAEARLPDHVTTPMIEQVLEPSRAQLTACVRNANASSARVILALDGTGAIQMISIQPGEIRACIEPIMRRHTYPGNSRGVRQQVSLTIRRR